jgi:hypothetical protein
MRIESAAVAMSATTSQSRTTTVSEQVNVWVGSQGAGLQAQGNAAEIKAAETSVVYERADSDFVIQVSEKDLSTIRLITKMLEAITGKKMHFFIPDSVKLPEDSILRFGFPSLTAQPGSGRKGWGLSAARQEITAENAEMRFDARGIINTADGRTLDVGLSLSVSRSFYSEETTVIKAGDALIDPIVVNFDAPAAQLTEDKFEFDIDSDGAAENISFVKSGSGFLVYDKNGDGKVNNGSEMFGPGSGNGFMELKSVDMDGNDWIDENDPIYDKLRIWTRDEQGNHKLIGIGKLGIGAIYLGNVSTPFELKGPDNTTHGKVQKTGIFVREDGTAGTVQHVDLSV